VFLFFKEKREVDLLPYTVLVVLGMLFISRAALFAGFFLTEDKKKRSSLCNIMCAHTHIHTLTGAFTLERRRHTFKVSGTLAAIK